MKCPDTDLLIDLASADHTDPDLQAHLEGCPSCRSDLLLIRELPVAFFPEVEVPEHLVRRAMAGVERVRAEEERRNLRMEVLGAGVLGSLTAAAVIFHTGVGSGGWALLAYCIIVGGLSGATRFGERRKGEMGRV